MCCGEDTPIMCPFNFRCRSACILYSSPAFNPPWRGLPLSFKPSSRLREKPHPFHRNLCRPEPLHSEFFAYVPLRFLLGGIFFSSPSLSPGEQGHNSRPGLSARGQCSSVWFLSLPCLDISPSLSPLIPFFFNGKPFRAKAYWTPSPFSTGLSLFFASGTPPSSQIVCRLFSRVCGFLYWRFILVSPLLLHLLHILGAPFPPSGKIRADLCLLPILMTFSSGSPCSMSFNPCTFLILTGYPCVATLFLADYSVADCFSSYIDSQVVFFSFSGGGKLLLLFFYHGRLF